MGAVEGGLAGCGAWCRQRPWMTGLCVNLGNSGFRLGRSAETVDLHLHFDR